MKNNNILLKIFYSKDYKTYYLANFLISNYKINFLLIVL